MANELRQNMLRAARLLGGFAIFGAAVVAGTYALTHSQIAANERAALVNRLNALVPPTQRDNDIDQDAITVTEPTWLGGSKPVHIYRARLRRQPVAAIIEAVAPDGYSGAIRLLVAITYDGTLAGVRVLQHRETPGLGDYIEDSKSNWVFNFDSRSLTNPTQSGWKVVKDGGVFDSVTGATITPRAVVKAVNKCLQYFVSHRETIFATAAMPESPK